MVVNPCRDQSEPPVAHHPYLAGPTGDKLRVSEVMANKLVTLRPVMKVRDLVETLAGCTHGAFPVTEREPETPGQPIELMGQITRNLLLKMLTHRVSFFHPDDPGRGRCRLTSG